MAPVGPPKARRRWPALALWTVSVLNLLAGSAAASALVLIPVSFDPIETLSAGTEPWLDAAHAVFVFLGLLVSTAVALRAWHSGRRATGLALTSALACCVIWGCAAVYAEYF